MGRDRAHLKDDGALPRSSQNPLWPSVDAADCFIVVQARENHVGAACEFESSFRYGAAPRNQSLGFSAIHVVCRHLVAVVKQPSRDASSHVAEADKTK